MNEALAIPGQTLISIRTGSDSLQCRLTLPAGLGFVPDEASPAFAAHQMAAREGLAKALAAIGGGNYDLVVLDEVCPAVAKGLLTEESVAVAIKKAGGEMVIVMTGRQAPPGLASLADTVTEMTMVKHGYGAGWPAQKGVEF